MSSSSYLHSRILTRLLGCLSIGLTVACQSQPPSVNDSTVNSVSPTPTIQPSSNLPPTNTSIPASPTNKPSTVAVPSPASTATSTPDRTLTTPNRTSTTASPIAKVPTSPTPKSPSPKSPSPKSPSPKSPSPKSPSPKPPQKAVTNKSSNLYQNQQMGIKFEYPEGYTVDFSKEENTIKVWLNQDYQAIKSGKYQNTESPSHLPSHLGISVEPNPQKLPSEEWVKTNDSFLDPEQFSNIAIAGKQALAFRSSGLFELEYLVIPSDNSNQMVVISIAEGDKKYQKVLNQVTSSLEMNK